MGTIDEILELQKKAKKIQKKWKKADRVSDDIIDDYGDLEAIDARRQEIRAEFQRTLTASAGDHGEFDSRHQVSRESGRIRWRSVEGCDSCEALLEQHGLLDLREEGRWLRKQRDKLEKALDRYNDLPDERESLLSEINEQAARLGLPSFQAAYDDNTGFTGFVQETDTVLDFMARGQYVLDSGTSITYGQVTVVLDNSEEVVAYRHGSSDWTVMRVTARPRITTTRGWYSVMRQDGTMEMMIGPDGESTNSYPHVHVIHDDTQQQIRVVASRSPSDHSPPEILPFNTDGNEINAAIERALGLL